MSVQPPGASSLVEADLHGLVDGYIPPDRRADALRRLAGSPTDRALVEAWQGQNDLLRSAFTAIVREPLPAILDLKAKPQLQCVPANDAPIIDFPHAKPPPVHRRKLGAAFAAVVVISAGLGGSWVLLTDGASDRVLPSAQLRGPFDTALAARSSEAVKVRRADAAIPRRAAESLPTTDIPDLRVAGFSFAGAETSAAQPVSIVFRYQNDRSERLAVTVAARDPSDRVTGGAPVQIGDAYSWRKGNKAYAIAGTVRPAQLRKLAVSLQKEDTQ